jgi:hypothetical protein
MKQEFEMTQEEMDDIISINENQMPVMKIGNVTTGMDLREKINNYWMGLSDKYGFKQMTVEGSSRGKLFFLAEPKPIVVPKTQSEIEIDKYLGESLGYMNSNVVESLKNIVGQLDKCEYECQGGVLKMNVAFLALKRMASIN